MKKKKLLRGLAIAVIPILILAAAIWGIGSRLPRKISYGEERSDREITYEKHYAFITDNPKDPFWSDMYESAKTAGKDQGIYVEMMGSSLSGSYSVSELLEMAIASRVDGIIVNPMDEPSFQLIETAAAKDINVLTVFNDVMNSSRICFVGVGNYKMGQEYGVQIRQLSEAGASNVLILIDSDDSVNQNLIYSGIRENLSDTDINIQPLMFDSSNVFGAEEAIRNLVLGSDQTRPDILVCLSAINTECAYQSVVDFNKVGQVHIVGYYGSDTVMEAIKKNIIDSVIKLDARQMGEKAVLALAEYQQRGRVNEYIVADTVVIDQSNVDHYLTSDSLEVSP